MAVADMTGAKTPDDAAYCWSRFLIESTMEKRVEGVGVYACVYPFTFGESGEIVMPTLGLPIGHPPDPKQLEEQLDPFKGNLYAYLVIMIGLPEEPGKWAGDSYTDKQRAEIPIGIPYDLYEKGEHTFYLFASLNCRSFPVTWAVKFDGTSFGEVRGAHGHYGGNLVGRLGLGDN